MEWYKKNLTNGFRLIDDAKEILRHKLLQKLAFSGTCFDGSRRYDLMEYTCMNCLVSKSKKLNKCSKCIVRYCSKECQTADWKKHKEHCVSFSKHSTKK